ncbi:MBL fold metallo-hydrolase [Hoyosella rhizosphaerae]|uniref:Metallo-beta-lactamase domain-containing protein n=2 Tax=Hoyosella rhizosphaerae TaxID=1755582 RepID=A0A916XHR2_9ACTN|nr:MBL fold metallo-hydrolase [Hoyosella rhizosphaerae]MBN4928173.1 MBL fold metallo-hydrolase [Hoyosella rhizosphaerae]GGC72986.1 hypothetical protein GCM10011410_27580 [Hoyosella rhizosphaerae]
MRIYQAAGASRSRIRPYAAGSPHFRDGRFHNLEPATPFTRKQVPDLLAAAILRGNSGGPSAAVPMAVPLAPVEASELAVTWLGHATAIVEIDGCRILTDPVWSDRVSPSKELGPKRMHPVPIKIAELPTLDAVLISHDHYDHLDERTVKALNASQSVRFIVPLGVGSHLRSWGVPDRVITELDWGDSTDMLTVGGKTRHVSVTCTPARHFSGRGFRRNTTLWASFVIAGERRRVFFGGDTGFTASFESIAADYGPFDVTLLPIGAYSDQWPDVHMNPEEAVQAHCLLTSGAGTSVLVPIHWGTFNLGFHSWSEPIVRLRAASVERGVQYVVPMPGQRVDALKALPREAWWVRCG